MHDIFMLLFENLLRAIFYGLLLIMMYYKPVF